LSKFEHYQQSVNRLFNNLIPITKKTIDAFHIACRYGTPEMISTFLSAGFSINAKNSLHFTPLMTSLEAGNYDVVQLLLCRGADFMIKNENKLLLSLPDTTKVQGGSPNSKYYALNLIAMTRYPHSNPFDACKETIKNMIINYTRVAQENHLLREV
jgi:ankyrin repeat protein